MVYLNTQELLVFHEGKVKRLLQHPEDDKRLIVCVGDRLTAGDGEKSAELEGIGLLRSQVIQLIFHHLDICGVPTHYFSSVWHDDSCYQVRKAVPFPIEVVVRFAAWGSLLKRSHQLKQGEVLSPPLTEVFYKCDLTHDPMIKLGTHLEEPHRNGFLSYDPKTGGYLAGSCESIFLEYDEVFPKDLLTRYDAQYLFYEVQTWTIVIGKLLERLLLPYRLIDLKLEFGWIEGKGVVLIDGVSPDEWRLIDGYSRHFDKQIFRNGGTRYLPLLKKRYQLILQHLQQKASWDI